MKKLMAILLALVLCLSMSTVVMAEEGDFVESITYKPAPGVIPPEGFEEGEIITIPVGDDKASEELKDLYEEILDDKENFEDYPELENWVVRDLFEVITKDDVEFPDEITFDTNLKDDDEVTVLEYQDGKWVKVEHKIDDGDLVVKLTDEGPVAILVPGEKPGGPEEMGDSTNQQMVVWVAVAALSLIAIAALMLVYRRKETEAE